MICAIILVNVAVWLYGLSPALDKIQAVRDELSRAEQQKTQLEQRLEQLNAIDVDTLQAELELLELQLPELGLLREFITELESMADELSLGIESLSASVPLAADPYTAIDFSFSVSGRYRDVFSYLQALEEHQRLLLVRTFNMSGSGDDVTCNLQVSIFAQDFEPHTPHEAPGRNNPFRGQ